MRRACMSGDGGEAAGREQRGPREHHHPTHPKSAFGHSAPQPGSQHQDVFCPIGEIGLLLYPHTFTH